MALKEIGKREDKFELLGYLYHAYMDWGKYRDALDFAHKQLFISEELDNPNMRAESYLNLAKAQQRLGGLERALSYARYLLELTFGRAQFCAQKSRVSKIALQEKLVLRHITGNIHLQNQKYNTLSCFFLGRFVPNQTHNIY